MCHPMLSHIRGNETNNNNNVNNINGLCMQCLGICFIIIGAITQSYLILLFHAKYNAVIKCYVKIESVYTITITNQWYSLIIV